MGVNTDLFKSARSYRHWGYMSPTNSLYTFPLSPPNHAVSSRTLVEPRGRLLSVISNEDSIRSLPVRLLSPLSMGSSATIAALALAFMSGQWPFFSKYLMDPKPAMMNTQYRLYEMTEP